MELQKFFSSWQGTLAENRGHRVVNAMLIVAVILLAFKSFTTETIVTIQPYTLTEQAQISNKRATASYHEAWGLYLSTLLGNTTPENASFIKERLTPLMSTRIRQDFITVVEDQVANISNDKVTVRFEPRYVLYEKDTGYTYVNGMSYLTDATNKESREEATYEFRITIEQFLPVIDHLNSYSGKPRSEKVLVQMQEREARKKERGRN